MSTSGIGEFYAALVSTMPFIRDPEVAEALAAWRAFMFCEELGVHKAAFEGDSLNVVNAINSHEECWRSYGNLVEAMQEKLVQHSEWLVNFTRREANLVAHCLAKHALEIHYEEVWKEVCPPFL
jgi:ribonuclease HI